MRLASIGVGESASAALRQVGAGINRRTLLGGDGSDHEPAWVELDL